jgi:MtN3 and saliva related transmembrane protein
MSVGVEVVGLAAAALTTGSFVPQVFKTWQSRDTQAISLLMYSMFTFGVALWLAYGVALGSPALIIANAVTLALSGFVLTMKLWLG